MRKLVKWFSLPLLFSVGLVLVGPQTADAARWRRHVPRAPAYRPYYAPPPVVRVPVVPGPRVRVRAPGVGVRVGPGVHVRAPGVGVHVGPRYRPFFGR